MWLESLAHEADEKIPVVVSRRIRELQAKREGRAPLSLRGTNLRLDPDTSRAYALKILERELEILKFLVAPTPVLSELPYKQRLAAMELFVALLCQVPRNEKRDGEVVASLVGALELQAGDGEQLKRKLYEQQDSRLVLRRVPAKRAELLRLLLAGVIHAGDYRPSQRETLRRAAARLKVPWENVEEAEAAIAEAVINIVLSGRSIEVPTQKVEADNRFWKIVAASLVAGVVLAATGGVAAPAIGGAIGTWGLGLTGAAATSAGTALLGGGALAAGGLGMAGGQMVVAGLFGLSGAGIAGRAVAKRTGAICEFRIPEPARRSIHVWMTVSGFLTQGCSLNQQWKGLAQFARFSELRSIEWEPQAQRDVGEFLMALCGRRGLREVVKYLGKRASKSAWRGLATPFLLLDLASVPSNPWSIAVDRAHKAGLELSHCLQQRAVGTRPVSLIGHSLGARVIMSALSDLARHGEVDLVHDVVLLGGAVSPTSQEWERARGVISGRLVNVYSAKDAILAWLYRVAEVNTYVAGLEPVTVDGIDSIDVTKLVSGHTEYAGQLPTILKQVAGLS